MRNKIIIMSIFIIFVASTIQLDAKSTIRNTSVNDPDEFVIYVDMSGIDRMPRTVLNNDEKQQLKEMILQDLRDNFAPVEGVNFNFTTDPSKERVAQRKVNILNNVGRVRLPNGETTDCYGLCPSQSNTVNVYLKNFYRHKRSIYAEGRLHNDYNVTKLANGIGAVCGHELGHSFCLGHNEHEPSDKMTNGSRTRAEDMATHHFEFDEHARDVVSRNARSGVLCNSFEEYFEEHDHLEAHFYDLPLTSGNDYWEYFRFDADFSFSGQYANNFEVGWLTLDSDNGANDGNAEWDFIYKTAMSQYKDQNAEAFTFFEDRTDAILFAIRGLPGTQWANEWYPIETSDVVLGNDITRPDGKKVSRHVEMGWDINNDGRYDVNIGLDSSDYNGFTYNSNGPAQIIIKEISGGIGVSAVLENIGQSDANDVSWSIEIEGNVFFGGSASGTVDIPKGDQVTVSSGLAMGFGPVQITVTADAITEKRSATLMYIFVLGL